MFHNSFVDALFTVCDAVVFVSVQWCVNLQDERSNSDEWNGTIWSGPSLSIRGWTDIRCALATGRRVPREIQGLCNHCHCYSLLLLFIVIVIHPNWPKDRVKDSSSFLFIAVIHYCWYSLLLVFIVIGVHYYSLLLLLNVIHCYSYSLLFLFIVIILFLCA